MPVRKMTAKEAEEIFGSGLIIIGLGRSMGPASQRSREGGHGQVASPQSFEAGEADLQRKGMFDSTLSVERGDEH